MYENTLAGKYETSIKKVWQIYEIHWISWISYLFNTFSYFGSKMAAGPGPALGPGLPRALARRHFASKVWKSMKKYEISMKIMCGGPPHTKFILFSYLFHIMFILSSYYFVLISYLLHMYFIFCFTIWVPKGLRALGPAAAGPGALWALWGPKLWTTKINMQKI